MRITATVCINQDLRWFENFRGEQGWFKFRSGGYLSKDKSRHYIDLGNIWILKFDPCSCIGLATYVIIFAYILVDSHSLSRELTYVNAR